MGKRFSNVGPLLGGLLLTLIAGVWFAHTSAYFMWGIVDDDTGTTVYIDQPSHLRPSLATLDSRYRLSRLLPFDPAFARRFALNTSPDKQTLAVIPVMGAGDDIKNQLIQNGWMPHRLAGLIVASRPPLPAPSRAILAAGAIELLRHLGFDGFPLNPLMVARVPSGIFPLLPEGLRGVVFGRRASVEGAVKLIDQWPKVVRRPAEEDLSGAELEFSLPGAFLDALPADIKNRWQEDIWQKFALTQSRPALLTSLRKYDSLSITLSGDSAAIAIQGQSQTARAQVEEWVESEQGYRTPTTVPFRLPDGTLGYEKRPSAAALTWQATPDGICRTTAIGDDVYWLCQSGDATAFARSQDSARQILKRPHASTNWHLRIGATALSQVISDPITSLTIQATSSDQITFRLDTAY